VIDTTESQALRYASIGDEAAGRPASAPPGEPERSLKSVGIVGAGTMGTGIAICCLDAGLPTRWVDAAASAAAAAGGRVGAHYDKAVSRGRLTPDAARERQARLATAPDYDALAGCDLVIEAVFEDMDVKLEVFRQLDRVLQPGALLASNTSTLDLDRIAAATTRPEVVVGLHFFSPAQVMRLLEVVRGRRTSAATLAAALRFGRSIGKVPVVAGVCDGFIGNRMIEEYARQAYLLVDLGVLPWRVDAVLERWGMAMGPFAVMDLAGGDIGWAIRKRRKLEQPGRPYSAFPDRVCELKRFGRKTGAGYYAYDADGVRREDPLITQIAVEHARGIACASREIPDEEIIERCIYALVNEGAKLLDEGIAASASDIDVVYRNGYGFPAGRGGPMFHADCVGLGRVLESMERFAGGYQGWAWQPAHGLLDAARRGARLTGSR
jgi:3-hydroxyacyl-CoA dehydrogenase